MPFTENRNHGPLELTQSEDGYFTQADTFDEEEVVVGDLDLDALTNLERKNSEFQRCY